MRPAPAKHHAGPPLLHSELVALAAPTQVWSAQDGTMGASGAHGLFHGDWRYLRDIELRINGQAVEPIATAEEADWIVFHALARARGTGLPLARVKVERMREVYSGGTVERVTLINGRTAPVDALIELVCDLEIAPMPTVRAGAPDQAELTIELDGDTAIVTDGTRTLRASSRGGRVRIEGSRVIVATQAHVAPDDWAGVTLELSIDDPSLAVHGATIDALCEPPLATGRPALDRWAGRALADIADLLLDAGHGAFPAAGAPWDVTMVARDALIACRLLLPLGGALAEGTLRTLAARQGVRLDPASGEEPGRILTEMRQRAPGSSRPGVEPPPIYSGSVDPTPLWIVLLHDAWQAGLPLESVRELRTALHSALGWMRTHAVRPGGAEGFLACCSETGMGLSGKDWKLEPEGMRFAESGTAGTAIVTAQLQGLACRAAMGGAALLDALGDDGEPWRAWAERLRTRFRDAFWVHRDGDRFPAMALADGHAVGTLASDIGQLLGTTLLSRVEEAEVVRLLLDERLSSGFGLRTMSTDAERYWPLAHYCGAIWPHDTAIAIEGMLRSGFHAEARELAEQLERAADAFGGRMPEVYAGYGLEDTAAPIPYPGACSPQAWSAAAVVPVHAALTRRAETQSPTSRERHLVALTPSWLPTAPEPMQINSGAMLSPTRARLQLVEPSSPATP